MNALEYNLRYATSIANYIHKNISPDERLLPIFLGDILKYRDDIIVKYKNLHGLDGCTVYNEKTKKYLIAIDNVNYERERQRFTLAHELGHIFLQHHTKNKHLPEYIKEQSANAFAGELLMPLEMMKKTSRFPDDYIFSLFGVSISAFNCRKDFIKRFIDLEKVKDDEVAYSFKEIFKYTKNYKILKGYYPSKIDLI